MPAGMVWGAIGNDITCDFQGFFTVIGASGAMLYSVSISVYFLLVIKFNVSNERIKQRYEPFLHAVPIIYSLTTSLWVFTTGGYNPAGTICWIANEPLNCDKDPDVDCVTTLIKLKGWVAAGTPYLGAFLLNCVIMFVLWFAEYSNFRRTRNHRLSFIASPSTPRNETENQDEEEGAVTRCLGCLARIKYLRLSSRPTDNVGLSPLAAHLSRPSNAAMRRRRSITNRALAYIIGYLMTYLFSFIYRFWEGYGNEVPFIIIFLTRLLYPLQGFFNVVIYSYPHVLNTRQKFPEYSWFKAFWEVVHSGGDNDQLPTTKRSRRRSSAAARRLNFPVQQTGPATHLENG